MTRFSRELDDILGSLPGRWEQAARLFWSRRESQLIKQTNTGKTDAGARGAVTGGKQMDGFLDVIAELLADLGVPPHCIIRRSKLELPGYYRPTKEWDLLVVARGQLVLVIEVKSQVGPSFGNNFNNRTEEAIGSATDLWTAFREGAFNGSVKPWLGYLFVLEECPKSLAPVKIREPHFRVFDEFRDSSYAKRYELFCRKLVRERLYDSVALIMSSRDDRDSGKYLEPSHDIALSSFTRCLAAHIASVGDWSE